MDRIDELMATEIVIPPDQQPWGVVITFAICLAAPEKCNWRGWILEGAMSSTPGNTEIGFTSIPAKSDQKCPACGDELFRMENSFVFTADSGREDTSAFMERMKRPKR